MLAIIIKEALFGAYQDSGNFKYAFAILPWFSFNVAASAFGDQLGRHFLRGGDAAMERLLLKTAASGIVIAAILNGAYHALTHFGYATGLHQWRLHSPFSKWPPSPIYFLFYGSIGLLLILGCLRAAANPKGRPVVSAPDDPRSSLVHPVRRSVFRVLRNPSPGPRLPPGRLVAHLLCALDSRHHRAGPDLASSWMQPVPDSRLSPLGQRPSGVRVNRRRRRAG